MYQINPPRRLPKEVLPTPTEQERQEYQRAERLAAKLRELGIDPDEV